MTLTTLGGTANTIIPASTIAYTAPATGPTNLACTGDAHALTAFEQANDNGTPLNFVMTNSCPYDIWPEVTYLEWPNSGSAMAFAIGQLSTGASYTWSDHPYWMTSARIWANEGCDADGTNCIVSAGNAPTLFEYNIYPDQTTCTADLDYDISLGKSSSSSRYPRSELMTAVDGHTIPLAITFDSSECPSRTCTASKTLNGVCPAADYNTIDGSVEGCLSSCSHLQMMGVYSGNAYDIACCQGVYNSPETCTGTSPWFSEVCPEAYSYAYDDVAANRACSMPGTVTIAYCPDGVSPY